MPTSQNPQHALDTTSFPAVMMVNFPYTLEKTHHWLQEIESLLQRKQNFAFVYPPMDMNMASKTENVEARKVAFTWFKTHKAEFTTYCKGLVLTVNQTTHDEQLLHKMIHPLTAVYGVPVTITASLEEANRKAHDLCA